MRIIALTALLAGGIAASAAAQREVAPSDYVQPTANDIVIGGNELAKDVRCDNNAVYVQGQHNEVQVHGQCKFIRVQGNQNYVWIERVTTAHVEGNDNTIFVSNPETRYSSRGNGNRFEKARR